MVTYLGSLVQSCCGEGGTLQTNITGLCGECSQCLGHTGFAPTHGVCAFLVYTAQAPGCSTGQLSKVCSGLHTLPRSKPLRFRFLGTPQKHRLVWAFVLCPSQIRAAQVARCLARAVTPRWVVGHCLPHASRLVFWMYKVCAFSGVPCVSSGELISGYNPSGICQPSRIPRTLG